MQAQRRLAFGYSTRCNIRCGHCVAADETPAAAKMPLATAKKIITQLAHARVVAISFTAGEPLLLIDDLLALIQLCRKYGIYTRVVTNAFWAKNPQGAMTTVSKLLVAGLCQLRLSTSRWHQQHIPMGNIVNAAAACGQMGLDCFVSLITDFTTADEHLEGQLRDGGLKFFPEPMIYFGRAGKLQPKRLAGDYVPHTCTMNPYLSPQLDMFACCDATGRFDRTGFLSLGNLAAESVADKFFTYENNPLYHAIRTVGLSVLASSVGITSRKIVTYRKCELCEILFNSKKYMARLQAMVSDTPQRWMR